MSEDITSTRIDTREAAVAEQQLVIDDLNDVITKQWDVLNAMQREISMLGEQVAEFEHSSSSPTQQKPPHY